MRKTRTRVDDWIERAERDNINLAELFGRMSKEAGIKFGKEKHKKRGEENGEKTNNTSKRTH